MDIMECMRARHSVRQYENKAIEQEKRDSLLAFTKEINEESGLHIQLVFDEPQAFDTTLAHYGSFRGVENYIVMVGKKGMDEEIGYYGEKLVLKAQEEGLNTCWVVLTYGKKKTRFEKAADEKLYCVIALGYGKTQGAPHRNQPTERLVSIVGEKPQGFDIGVEAALLAPTAVNQQKFRIQSENGKVSILTRGVGTCLKLDLGIVKYHFEAASGIKVFSR